MDSELTNHFIKISKTIDELPIKDFSSNDNINTDLISSEIKTLLSDEDFLIYKARLNGASIRELASIFDTSTYAIRKRINLIKDKIKNLIN